MRKILFAVFALLFAFSAAALAAAPGAELTYEDVKGSWYGDWNGTQVQANVTRSQVTLGIDGHEGNGIQYDYEWSDGKTEYDLTPFNQKRVIAVMKFTRSEKLTLTIEGAYEDSAEEEGEEDKLVPISVTMTPYEPVDADAPAE
jgi:opacity protein-like surface antigen